TIDVGARLDASLFPSSLGITNRQVSPRFGVAWMPTATWVIRGGAGLFADRFVLAAVYGAWLAQQRKVFKIHPTGPANPQWGPPRARPPFPANTRPAPFRPRTSQSILGWVFRAATDGIVGVS